MKQCPNCRTTYTDDTLSYCLADGSRLDPAAGEQMTQVRSGGPAYTEKTAAFGERDKMRIDIAAEKTQPAPPAPLPAKSSGSGLFKVVAVAAVLLVIALAGVGAVGALVYFTSQQSGNAAVNNPTPSPAPTRPQRTAANETDELRDQIANLQRQLDEQKKSKGGSTAPLTVPRTSGSMTTARANSPGDGFLALRALPSTDIGERIAKIPHGADVAIGGCGPVVRSGSKTGRWCQARYEGRSGWVFDAYLKY